MSSRLSTTSRLLKDVNRRDIKEKKRVRADGGTTRAERTTLRAERREEQDLLREARELGYQPPAAASASSAAHHGRGHRDAPAAHATSHAEPAAWRLDTDRVQREIAAEVAAADAKLADLARVAKPSVAFLEAFPLPDPAGRADADPSPLSEHFAFEQLAARTVRLRPVSGADASRARVMGAAHKALLASPAPLTVEAAEKGAALDVTLGRMTMAGREKLCRVIKSTADTCKVAVRMRRADALKELKAREGSITRSDAAAMTATVQRYTDSGVAAIEGFCTAACASVME